MTTIDSPTFGALLKQYRTSAGLTQEALAERAGLSTRAISDLERGINRAPRMDTLRLLSDALGLREQQRVAFEIAARPAVPHPESADKYITARNVNLPVQLTPLVGREPDVAAVQEHLRRPNVRLVTLMGPGGIGKTRLAVAVASGLVDDFADGIVFVDLSAIADPVLVGSNIAQAFGIKETSGPLLVESLKAELQDKHLLLVLDNFEQVISAAPLVAELLAACPQCTALVTSRTVLRLSAEHTYVVPPLALPDPAQSVSVQHVSQYAAVQLFAQRAQAARSDYKLTEEHASAVSTICRQLDGLPLAIELAAARIRVLPPEAILARLDNRLALLTGGARDLPVRQQTLRATLDWSYGLLPEREQRLFACIGVFVGGFTLDAVQHVCAGTSELDVLEGVSALVDNNLVRQVVTPHNEPRFETLAMLREYALERLVLSNELDKVRRAHAAYFLALAEEADRKIRGAEQTAWFARLEAEHDNLRAALAWSVETEEVEFGLRIAAALARFWWLTGRFSEGRAWLEQMLQRPGSVSHELRGKALLGAGRIAMEQGEVALAASWFEESLAFAQAGGDKPTIAEALTTLGEVAVAQGEYARAVAINSDALKLAREAGDRWSTGWALIRLGGVAALQANYQEAATFFEELLTISKDMEDKTWIAYVLYLLGSLALLQNDHSQARALAEESFAIAREVGFVTGVSHSGELLARLQSAQGESEAAASLLHQSLTMMQQSGSKGCVAHTLEGFARLALAQGQAQRAAQLLGAAEAICDKFRSALFPTERALYEQSVAAVRAALSAGTFARSWSEGRTMTIDTAMAYAIQAGIGPGIIGTELLE